jgi:hypothetical protein
MSYFANKNNKVMEEPPESCEVDWLVVETSCGDNQGVRPSAKMTGHGYTIVKAQNYFGAISKAKTLFHVDSKLEAWKRPVFVGEEHEEG